MADLTEIEALKASLRGARRASDALTDVATRVDMADSHVDVPEADLDELRRLTLANAIAGQALRGLVESMLRRRGQLEEVVADGGTGGIDE